MEQCPQVGDNGSAPVIADILDTTLYEYMGFTRVHGLESQFGFGPKCFQAPELQKREFKEVTCLK